MRGTLVKRSLNIGGKRTSVALEPEFWDALQLIARARGQSLPKLIGRILSAHAERPAASTLRVYLLNNSVTHDRAR